MQQVSQDGLGAFAGGACVPPNNPTTTNVRKGMSDP